MTAQRLLVADLRSTAAAFHLPDRVAAALRAATPPDWRLHIVATETDSFGDGAQTPSDESLAQIPEAEVYVGFGMPKSLFLAGRKLRWVQTGTAGVATLLFDEMHASDVVVTNAAGLYGPTIAEYVLGGVLHFLRGFDLAAELRQSRTWDQSIFSSDRVMPREIADLTVLVVGAGGIGGEIGKRFHALGARVIGLRRRPALGAPEGFDALHPVSALDEHLPEADVVVLATPLTPDTRGILTAERIARLKPSAIVANIARGALVDEPALTAALQAGRIRGAVLDVFAKEPLAAESPLWQLERVLVTPHVSGVAPQRFWTRFQDLIIDNWRRYRAGEPLRNVVDKRAGY